jgi:acyl-coenzyme A thioesterase 13
MVSELDIPSGFVPAARSSPLADLLGPIYSRGSGAELSLGLRAQQKHSNMRGIVHGGVLAALADMALGYTLAFSSEPPVRLVTANLTIDYAGSAKIGDWLYTRTDIQRQGGRLAFASCFIYVEEQRIVRASGVFLVNS